LPIVLGHEIIGVAKEDWIYSKERVGCTAVEILNLFDSSDFQTNRFFYSVNCSVIRDFYNYGLK